jgi:hypothetical protein
MFCFDDGPSPEHGCQAIDALVDQCGEGAGGDSARPFPGSSLIDFMEFGQSRPGASPLIFTHRISFRWVVSVSRGSYRTILAQA